jgi:hypothetical protein
MPNLFRPADKDRLLLRGSAIAMSLASGPPFRHAFVTVVPEQDAGLSALDFALE